jgi:hypothetical protein
MCNSLPSVTSPCYTAADSRQAQSRVSASVCSATSAAVSFQPSCCLLIAPDAMPLCVCMQRTCYYMLHCMHEQASSVGAGCKCPLCRAAFTVSDIVSNEELKKAAEDAAEVCITGIHHFAIWYSHN